MSTKKVKRVAIYARVSEVLRTDVAQDIDREYRTWYIHDNKGDLPRTVPLTDRAYKAFLQGPIPKPFKGLTTESVGRAFGRVVQAAGYGHMTGFTLHALRHTCATRLLRRTGNLKMVKEILGHSSLDVSDGYTQLAMRDLEVARAALTGPGPMVKVL